MSTVGGGMAAFLASFGGAIVIAALAEAVYVTVRRRRDTRNWLAANIDRVNNAAWRHRVAKDVHEGQSDENWIGGIGLKR